MPYKRNVNADNSAEWTPSESGGSGGLEIGSKWPLPCFSLGVAAVYNYQMIDDYPSVDDNTYNTVSTNGKKDYFAFQGFNFGGDEYFDYDNTSYPPLAIVLRGRYDDEGDAIQAVIVVDGVPYEADVPAPNGTFNGAFTEYTFYWELNPVTLDYWTYEQLNGTAVEGNLELVGYDSGSNATGERKVSRMYVISYPWKQAELTPSSDTAVQWSRQGGSYNYENLFTYTGDPTDYNYTNVQNEIDKFGFDNNPVIPDDSDILWVYPGGRAIRISESGYKMQFGIWIDGTVYMQNTLNNLGDGWDGSTFVTDGWKKNPKTSSAWTSDDINGIGSNGITDIGYKHTFGGVATTQICLFYFIVELFPNDEPA